MNSLEIEAHFLAHDIEWIHAKERSKSSRLNKSPEFFYDPHAATELGNLLYNRLCRAQASSAGEKEPWDCFYYRGDGKCIYPHFDRCRPCPQRKAQASSAGEKP